MVPDLVADGLLGIDLEKSGAAAVVTRAQTKQKGVLERGGRDQIETCDVQPRNMNNVVTHEEARIEQYDPPEISLEKLSVVDGNKLSQLQRQDPSLKHCRDKAFKNESQTENELKAFYWGNDILKLKWTSEKKNL